MLPLFHKMRENMQIYIKKCLKTKQIFLQKLANQSDEFKYTNIANIEKPF